MSTTESHPFAPDYVSPPGDTLRDRLTELHLPQSELARRAGFSTKHVNQIMQGLAPITPETALALERITGIPARFWNRREADYREGLLRAKSLTLSPDDEQWLTSLPVKELQKRKLLPSTSDRGRLFDAALTFFGVANTEAFYRIWRGPVASFRRSQTIGSHSSAVISWIRIAQIEALSIEVTSGFSAPAFRKVLHTVRALTLDGDPNEMVDLCASVGVVVVFVPEVKGCRTHGATWWDTPNRAVIALSDRFKKDDHFWFTFFHEAAHVLLHSKKETFVDDGSEDDSLEDEANKFARDFLIPPDRASELKQLRTDSDVKEFANNIGIAPGIVVGRMQHDKIWAYNLGHKLKRTLTIVDDE
ncbi:ImmA/IrrE family metallo-endopeptidase [Rhodococcus fascians]|jgi:HTH-type transcriptional regulator/antitoxin HigA|uniref:ImmA/IrrE family metallo-endopeptidase n=1 Tax=unclassified Rhodococcus (in: high G+C Gram-positive bacteria) TaxID=192944 RepID=UPI000B9B3CA5|nr:MULTISPECIES: ImmA/IrrE family metallo-endopeptidase [unclassified Rhodococcus (in: high G+C Gram-positive bacteria)]MBY3792866.1 ImmA/IrrE family metallo-endopeptidase [Rhodococcus fascians]MBY3825158.1 ImmA/IrrE family metallo-endopeptidase [Rhodococcus fascians]MBY3835619.1 ImmA/IrrE family metallo-endopeptidase [Rhodococcus fascians]MBY3864831.1 ImmA/IrrE family metallo-endopeptidase [Rhodococcus fascians]MBY3884767.1 ImmA/IrrE family metallo-endopeptidase [Rhodococcus fascians]